MTAYGVVVRLVHLLLRMFFRRVEVSGLEHIPSEGGGILVSWHPNGMIDPALIFETFPRNVVFGARHGLFRVPVMGWIMKAVGTVPIYRAVDAGGASPEARREANRRSLDALAGSVAAGSFSCLFPEGDSHDAPHLIELKTGVARFYYRARQLMEQAGASESARAPVIIPVGLHYDHKRVFRSNVLVAFHPPLELPRALDLTPDEDEDEDEARARYRALTARVETALTETVHATESWEIHHLMHRARKIVRAERAHRADSELEAPTMEERTRGFARIWSGYNALSKTQPDEVAALTQRVADYDKDLRALEMEDHELDRGPAIVNPWLGILLVVQALLVYLLMPPLMLVGAIINAPPALALWAISRAMSKKKKDEASLKVLFGVLVFPLTWLTAALLAGWGHAFLHELYPAIPDTFITAGVVTALLAIAGGAVSLRYLRLATETARAIRVRLTRERRRMAIARLRLDRGDLFEALTALGAGLELPGTVEADGRIGPSAATSPPLA